MESEKPALLPVVQETQAQPPSGQPVLPQQQQVSAGQPIAAVPGQPIMYQMAPGQPGQPAQPGQPVFIQVPPGQPAMTPQGQPVQYYYVPVGQPVQEGQKMQPGQTGFAQGAPGQPVQPGQPVFIQGGPGQYVQPQQQSGGFEINIDNGFLRSPLCFIKIAEFVTLLGAWASVLKYTDKLAVEDEKANFFKGIMIFSWVMVILYLIINALNFPKMCNCKRPSLFTITSLVLYFILFSLLLACTGNLVPRAVKWGKVYKILTDEGRQKIIALYIALAFGFISCVLFVMDMALNHKLFQTQRAQELPLAPQGPPQRRVWDINQEYLKSPVFYIKLAEMALLFGAWVCILKYFDMDIIERAQAASSSGTSSSALDLSKEEFFRGITIFSWVMVILLALFFIFSFDKISSRSSPWTLTACLFYIFMAILLIASCGNLTPLVVDFAKVYKNVYPERKPNVLALFIGLGLGYISWIIFIVDISLLYKLYRQQRIQEFPPQQVAGQTVVQPGVMIMPQNLAQGGQQQVFQPSVHPGQQVVQYPGQQQPAAAPPLYNPQPQDPTQKQNAGYLFD